jgi:hypothetical protein
MPGVGRPSSRQYGGKPAAGGRATRRRNRRLSGTLGDEIGIVAADDIETPPHIILARRFDLK